MKASHETVKSGIDPDVFFQIIRSYRDFTRMIAELVVNEIDWRVPGSQPEIVVRFTKEGRSDCLEIVGQGRGADQDGRTGFTSLGKSQARGNAAMKGDKGSGSKGPVWHCREIVVETVPVPGKLYRITFTVEQLIEWLFKGATGGTWQVSDKPPRHPIRATGTRVILRGLGEGTGYVYRGKPLVRPSGTDKNQEDRSPERVVAELAECLPPNAHRFVTVIGYDEKATPLTVRKIEGDPVIGDAHNVPGVGDVSWDMAVVANKRPDDRLTVGALGTKVSWSEFVRLIHKNKRYANLLKQLDPFGDPHVAGHIEAPRINDFRGVNSNSIEGDIAEDEALVEGILITLIEQALPGVAKALNVDQKRATSDQNTFVAELARLIQDATGVKPKGPTRRVTITQRHSRLVLEPGESHEVEVKADPSVRVVWDDSRSGGTLNTRRGPKVTYTAGGICGDTFVLVARDMADATQVLYEVTIEIVAQMPFEFSRAVYRMDLGDRVRVSIDERAVRHTSGRIVIALAQSQPTGSPSDVRIEHRKDAAEAYVLSGTTEGYVDVEAYDAADRSRFHARAKVSVERGFRDRSRSSSPLDTEFVYDGRPYELAVSSYSGSREAFRHVSYLSPAQARSTITLNLSHPLFDGKPDVVRREAALWQVALRIAEDRNPDATLEELIQEAGIVYSTIIKAV